MKKVLVVILFVFTCFKAFPQLYSNPSFKHLPVKNLGLKTAFGQTWDKQGNMWMVYEEGVFCYNGYTGKKFKHIDKDSSTILSSSVQGLYVDKKNNLWIIYANRPGISKMNLENYKIVHFYPDTNSTTSVPTELISGFKEDDKGNLWLLTWGGGLVKMNPENGICKTYKPNPDKPNDNHYPKALRCKSMHELPDGRFLAGFWGMAGYSSLPAYFDPVKETFTEIDLTGYLDGLDEIEKENILRALKIVHFVYVDENNNYWFGTYSCLILVDNKQKTARRISGNPIESGRLNLDNANRYIIDDKGLIWVGSPNNAIMMVNPETKKAWYINHDPKNAASLADNRIRTMKKDAEGNIWIVTQAGVFSIYVPLLQNFKLSPWDEMGLGYSNRSAQVIPVNQMNVHSDDNIYLSSETGLTVFNPTTQKVIETIDPVKIGLKTQNQAGEGSRIGHFKFLDSNRVFLIGVVDRGEYNLKTKKFTKYTITIPDDKIEQYKKNNTTFHLSGVWFKYSTNIPILIHVDVWNGELYELGTGNKSKDFKRFMKLWTGSEIHGGYSYIMKDGRWLIGANDQGFYILDKAKNKIEEFSANDSLHYFPDSTITTCYRDKQQNYWFGTKNGLYSYDFANGKCEYMNPKLGLGYEEVNSMIEDAEGNIWMALEKEILKWNPATNATFKFGREFGLTANSFVSSVGQSDSKGNIYFMSVNGLVSFHPKTLSTPSTKNKLRLSFVSIKDDTLNLVRLNEFENGTTTLSWNQNFINFEFCTYAGFNIAPHNFYYRLIGLDTIWQSNEISNRIRFTNLSPGSYTLQVKLVNAYGTESEILSTAFKIKPPFWQTWWFYTLAGGTLLLSAYGYMRYRERAFRRKQEILESKIKERTAEVVAKAKEIEQQKDIILEKNKELTDSIHYAQRIQQSILPQDKEIRNGLKEHFVYFKPKDIVSGDFYWYSEQKDSVLWAVVDCTGHGVPGGFMSMLGSGLLNQIVNEELKLEPNVVLDNLCERVIMALKQTGEYGESRDGMDIAFCRYIKKENKIQFAGANNEFYLVRKNELIELSPDKQPIGIHLANTKPFTLKEINVEKGDCVYISSDGYADQFGGPKGKKFKSSNLEKLFLNISKHPIEEQKQLMDKTFQEWKGIYEQLDDVCIVGVKF